MLICFQGKFWCKGSCFISDYNWLLPLLVLIRSYSKQSLDIFRLFYAVEMHVFYVIRKDRCTLSHLKLQYETNQVVARLGIFLSSLQEVLRMGLSSVRAIIQTRSWILRLLWHSEFLLQFFFYIEKALSAKTLVIKLKSSSILVSLSNYQGSNKCAEEKISEKWRVKLF